MHHLIRLDNYSKDDILEIFKIADEIGTGKYNNFLDKKTILLFFSNSSVRTRISFEKGISLLGGQAVTFPPETLDKREKLQDLICYLNNWVDAAVIRHKNIEILNEVAKYATFPIINALTDENHPCEIISDLYALSKIRNHFCNDTYLFVGAKGNIGNSWKEASNIMGFSLTQCCPKGYELDDVDVIYDLKTAMKGKDIISTDSLTHGELHDFKKFQVSSEMMSYANSGAVLNPCPPFYRGEEVSSEVIESGYFVGYKFKKHLLEIQQAILIFNMLYLELKTKPSSLPENDQI